MRKLIHLLALLVSLISFTRVVPAQVFVPDTLMRTWLNQSIPGIVDANGIMDTLHAGIASCDSVVWTLTQSLPDTLNVDLTGLSQLNALRYLSLNLDNSPAWNNTTLYLYTQDFPVTMETFILNNFGSKLSIFLTNIGNNFRTLSIYNSDPSFMNECFVTIESITDSINTIMFTNLSNIIVNSFNGIVNNVLYPYDPGMIPHTLNTPFISANLLSIYSHPGSTIDLFAANTSIKELVL